LTELLLITDIPRLRKIFSRMAEEPDLRLRVSTSLENGAQEIIAEKPAFIFVQTHLSGFSPEILLMHLKKQLGKKRSRFILLSTKEQTNEEVLKLYQGHIDTSLDDNQLFEAIKNILKSEPHQNKTDRINPSQPADELHNVFTAIPIINEIKESGQTEPASPEIQIQKIPTTESTANENTLEEQGIIYSRRSPLSVYSEFTSSFDSAISNMPSNEPENKSGHWSELQENATDIEETQTRPRWVTLLFWALPVLAIVVAVTMLQQFISQPNKVNIAPALPVAPSNIETPPAVVKPTEKVINTQLVPVPVPIKEAAPNRLTKLPDFVPAGKLDSSYGKTNPGWELYKGSKKDFKVFREGGEIKAIQVIDREGKGMSNQFMFDILKQIVKSPKFTVELTEKKDGYEIRRGRLTEDLTMVQYVDTESSKLRAFVVTWK
jgi:DNA-binding response OmpR family regulator